MNWIRDNILKLVVILVIIIVAIVIVSLFAGGDGSEPTVTATGYEELENKLQAAAINYAKDHKDLRPKTVEKPIRIKLATLIDGRYIGEIHAIDNSNTVCTGYVDIVLKEEGKEDYKLVPHLICGNYYETSTIKDYIIKKDVVTSGDGLYQDGNGYVYKGDYPTNNIMIGDVRYRILSITDDGYLKLLSTNDTVGRYIWDDRYNIDVDKLVGINTYNVSRMKENLEYLYSSTSDENDDEIYFTDDEREYMVEYPFCVGKLNPEDPTINPKAECAETSIQKVGLMNVSDYFKISTSANCKDTSTYDCNNYNYLFDTGIIVTMNASSQNTYDYLIIKDGEIKPVESKSGNILSLVIYIEGSNVFVSGEGTREDPYIIR